METNQAVQQPFKKKKYVVAKFYLTHSDSMDKHDQDENQQNGEL